METSQRAGFHLINKSWVSNKTKGKKRWQKRGVYGKFLLSRVLGFQPEHNCITDNDSTFPLPVRLKWNSLKQHVFWWWAQNTGISYHINNQYIFVYSCSLYYLSSALYYNIIICFWSERKGRNIQLTAKKKSVVWWCGGCSTCASNASMLVFQYLYDLTVFPL